VCPHDPRELRAEPGEDGRDKPPQPFPVQIVALLGTSRELSDYHVLHFVLWPGLRGVVRSLSLL
jgi:hypothetical protein